MPPTKRQQAARTRRAKAAAAAEPLFPGGTAIVYGGGGRIGAGIARTFSQEGARVFLAGRSREPVAAVAGSIEARGGSAEWAELDVTDERAVNEHADAVAAATGRIDAAITVISYGDVPGQHLLDLSPDDLIRPVSTAVRANFITARAVARHMTKQGSGAILTVTNGASRAVTPTMGATGVTAAAVETFTRYLASEVGPAGVRVLGLRIAAVPETWSGKLTTSDLEQVMGDGGNGTGQGLPPGAIEAMVAQLAQSTMLHRLSTLAEVADVAVFLASSRAGAMTGTVTNVTCGSVLD